MKREKGMLLASMFIFGSIGIFRRYIPIGSAPLAMFRGLIGMITLLLVVVIQRKRIDFGAIRDNIWALALSGIFLGVNWILLFEAYNYTTIATATLCYYMAPIFIMIVSPVLLKEKITKTSVICIVSAMIGMVFVSGILETGVTGQDFRGVLFGVAAACFYAGVVLSNKLLKNITAYDKTIIQLGVSAVVICPYVLLKGGISVSELSMKVILLIIVVGVIHTGLAYVLYFGSMDGLSAQTVALYGYVDPVLAIVLASLIFREYMSMYEMVGTVCILGATLYSEIGTKN